MFADLRTEERFRSNSSSFGYGRFVEPDPIGYEDGLNLYSYVGNDPVNWIDPLGLCGSNEISVFSGGGSYAEPDGTIVVYKNRLCISRDGGSAGTGINLGGILGSIGDALDKFAEDNLKPPPPRQPGESREQCEARIAGATPALAISGASGVAAGGAFLGYSRVGIAGGGGGTSLISSAARGSMGKAKFSGALGTGSVGGFIGRLVSKVSVVVGAAEIGLAAGITAGARERCK